MQAPSQLGLGGAPATEPRYEEAAMRTGIETPTASRAATSGFLPELGVDAYTSPTPAVRGTMPGHTAWTGSEKGEGLARSLGWFSIGLGLAEVAAPRGVARLIGLKPTSRNTMVLRLLGVRELAVGVGVLTNPMPRGWLATRVAGDIMDLALLGGVLALWGRDPIRAAGATAAVLGVTALDLMAVETLTESRKTPTRTLAPDLKHTPVFDSIIVEAPVDVAYAFWRDVTNLPSLIRDLESVEELGEGRSRWRALGPQGRVAQWEAEIIEEVENTSISWRALSGARPFNSGTVRFRTVPGGRGTMISVEMRYSPPAGKLGAALLKLMRREPGQLVAEALRNFKQIMETGEILVSDATVLPGPRPARPPTREELQR